MSDVIGICALCDQEKALLESHIIPKFVFRWMKRTGGTGYLRGTKNIDVRLQDGFKKRLLCTECELLLNGWETQFANKFFNLAVEDGWPNGTYTSWLSKFFASVVWRAALHMESEALLDDLSEDARKDLVGALSTWKAFILAGRTNPGKNELHLIAVGEFSQLRRQHLPPNWHRYTQRTTEMDYSFNDSGTFSAIHVKMGPVSVFGHIKNSTQRWVGTRVAVNHGNFRFDATLPTSLIDYYIMRAERSREKLSNMSTKQKGVVARTILDNTDRLRTSDFLKVMEQDVNLFGRDAFND